jgi:cbb3-type cytochrome oxidase subunit 3
MHKEVLSHLDQLWMPIVAMFIFATCYSAYVYWTYRKQNKPLYEEAQGLPLSDGEKHES